MMDMVIPCPICLQPVEVRSKDFSPTMPLYDEQEIEAIVKCKCGKAVISVSIFLSCPEDEEEDYELENVQIDFELLTAS